MKGKYLEAVFYIRGYVNDLNDEEIELAKEQFEDFIHYSFTNKTKKEEIIKKFEIRVMEE